MRFFEETRSREWTGLAYPALIGVAAASFFVIRALGATLSAPVSPPFARSDAVPPLADPLLAVLVTIGAVVLAGRLLGRCLRPLGQPAVIAEVWAGLLLGPSMLGRLVPGVSSVVFPSPAMPYVGVVAQLGIVFYMFRVGVRLDAQLLRARVPSVVAISHASIVVPFVLGSALALWLYPRFSTSAVAFTEFALFLGVAMSVTAFPVLARILAERGLADTELGAIALACAAVDDVTGWCLLALVVGLVRSHVDGAGVALAMTALFAAVIWFVVKPRVERLSAGAGPLARVPETTRLLLFGALLSALATEFIGIHAIFGAFVFGLIIPAETEVARTVVAQLDGISALLLPAYFAFTGMRTNVGLLSGRAAWVGCALVIVAATLGKCGGAFLGARTSGLSSRAAFRVGTLMNTRGLIELVVLNVGLDLHVLTPVLFTMMVLMCLVTTMATAPLLSISAGGERDAQPVAAAANSGWVQTSHG